MVRIFIVLILLLNISCSGQTASVITSDHIRIDHSGPIDKPIIPLVISTTKLDLPITEMAVLVNEDAFTLVVNYIEGNKNLASKKELNEFGVFKITKFINGKPKVLFTLSRINSIHFFKDLKEQLSNRESAERLNKEINYIISRIKGRDG